MTKEQDTSDSELYMPLATVPLPQEQHLFLASLGDGMNINNKRLFVVFFVMFVDLETAEKENTAMSQSCDTATLKSITVLPHDSILDLNLEWLEI